MKKIVIDARMYGLENTGIGRYIINLIKNLVRQPADRIENLRIILLVKKEKLGEIKKDLGDNFEYVAVRAKHYSFAEQIEIPLILHKIQPDLAHFLHFNAPLFYRGKLVITIHDLIKHYSTGKETTTRASFFYWLKFFIYKFLVNSVVKRAKLIFVPTNFWKKELVKKFRINPKKIKVTYEAVDESFIKEAGKNTEVSLKKYGLKKPLFVYTGNVYPHKNLRILLQALKKMPWVNLAVVCSRSVFTERMQKLSKEFHLEDRVKFLGFVDDKNLTGLYRQAAALVHPSLMEGFGLTGLEAAACGCPVVSSNASCLPEVYKDAVLYFNPYDADDLVKKMKMVLKNKELRKELVKKGKKLVGEYSWKKMAEETVQGYREVLGIRNNQKRYEMWETHLPDF